METTRQRCRKLTSAELARSHEPERGEHITMSGDTVERDSALVERITLAESNPWHEEEQG